MRDFWTMNLLAAKNKFRIISIVPGGMFCRAGAMIFTLLLAGCDINSGDNIATVPELGLFMFAEANHHETEDTAQISAAVFRDGQPVALVGGDVFEVRTATDRILLKVRGSTAGSYVSSLPVDTSAQNVSINVVHAPVEAREDRWYPIDLLNIDPGPGELVGKTATVSFPPAVTITGPAADTVYTSTDEVIDLTWVAGGEGDTMRVLSAVSCTDGVATSSYGTVVDIVDDDGLEAISVDKFIYDLNDGSPAAQFISGAVLGLLQELLNKLSAGNIDPDFWPGRWKRTQSKVPVRSGCFCNGSVTASLMSRLITVRSSVAGVLKWW